MGAPWWHLQSSLCLPCCPLDRWFATCFFTLPISFTYLFSCLSLCLTRQGEEVLLNKEISQKNAAIPVACVGCGGHLETSVLCG